MSTVNLGSVVGPAGDSVFVPVSTTETGIDKTYNELLAYINDNKIPYIYNEEPEREIRYYSLFILGIIGYATKYKVSFVSKNSVFDFYSDNTDTNMLWDAGE